MDWISLELDMLTYCYLEDETDFWEEGLSYYGFQTIGSDRLYFFEVSLN